jgi:hypothetical protein
MPITPRQTELLNEGIVMTATTDVQHRNPLPPIDSYAFLHGQKCAVNQVLVAAKHLWDLKYYADARRDNPDLAKLAELPLTPVHVMVLASAIEFFGVEDGLRMFIEQSAGALLLQEHK